MKIVIVSGGFDPIHSGHIEYFKSAKSLGDKLLVALNSDNWLVKKKGKFFMPFVERRAIVESIKYVDEVIEFDDDKKGSCINALEDVKLLYPNDQIYFANGGDRNKENIPEMAVSNINFIFSVGGENKKNSSSWILNNWQYYFEERQWGSFFNLFETKDLKVKELIIEPGKAMSFQKHLKRNEIWLVSKGSCEVNLAQKDPEQKLQKIVLNKFDYHIVSVEEWHQICNPFNESAHIIEIQYGDECIEEDIVRYSINKKD
tara:strand:+ start:1236 stop:2012 length:777 start_codon:yes stop_codon:yes gene_type:complete